MAQKTLKQKCFENDKGEVVLGQKPNLPLITAIIFATLGFVFTEGKLGLTIESITYGALFTFAWLELFQGVNYFRRALGLVVLAGAVYSAVY